MSRGHSHKFVLGGIKVFWGYKTVIAILASFLPHKKFTWTDLGGINTDIPPPRHCDAPAVMASHIVGTNYFVVV